MRRSTVLVSAAVGFAASYLVVTAVLGSPPIALGVVAAQRHVTERSA